MMKFRFDDADQYVGGTPYEAFKELRRHSPFCWQSAGKGVFDGFWIALKHRDIISISKQNEKFSTYAPLLSDPIPRGLWNSFPALAAIADNLMTFEHQKHSVFRSLGNSTLSAFNIAKIGDTVHQICVNTILSVANKSRFDFATDVALKIPVDFILGQVLGIPVSDLDKVTRWILSINAMDDPFFRPNERALFDAAEALFAYGVDSLNHRMTSKCGDLLSHIVKQVHVDGFSAEQIFLSYWFPLAAGAFDTTASVIAGGTAALLSHPDQLRLIESDRTLRAQAVDEMLRWVSPVVYFRRTALADIEYEGNHIKAGQKIVLCYASANRDEEVFTEPDRFEVGRQPNNHLSFGYGPHYCLGARVALLTLQSFLNAFLEQGMSIQLDGSMIRTRSNWMNRIRSMPVRNTRTIGF
jgi:cholest-4-en-3-one 26-monooxygenase